MATETRRSGSGARALLADSGYVAVWTIGTLTGIVRWLQLLVLGVYTLEISGSPLLVSLVPMLWMAPLPLFGPAAGVIADRFDRRLLLALSLVLICAVSAGMALIAWLGRPDFLDIAVVSVLSGLFWMTDLPIRRRLLGDLSGEHLAAGMSLDAATNNATRMLGPLLGGVLLQSAGILAVFLFSGLVYLVCLLLVLAVRAPAEAGYTASPAFIRDTLAGIRFVLGDRGLRRIFAITIIFNIWGFPFTSMIPVLGRERLGLDPFMVGVLSSLEGFGALIGAVAVAIFAVPAAFFRIYAWGTVTLLLMVGYLAALSAVAGGPHHSLLAIGLAIIAAGCGTSCFGSMQGTLSYLGSPPVYRSRVLGVLTLCIGTSPLGFFNIGWMAESFGVSWALCISSLEGLFALLLLWVFGGDGRADVRPGPVAAERPGTG